MAERLNYQCKFEKYKEELIRLRRHFHRHPELGLQEFETSAFIQEYLGKLGYRFRIVEPTGIIAEHPCQDEAAFAGKRKLCFAQSWMHFLYRNKPDCLTHRKMPESCMPVVMMASWLRRWCWRGFWRKRERFFQCGCGFFLNLPKKSVKVQSECWQQVPLMENQIFFSCFITQWISLLEWQCMRDRLRL